MRQLLLVTLFLLPACDDTPNNNNVVHDLSVKMNPDLTLGPLSCNAALMCYQNCMDNTCIDDCYARDTAKAKALDDDLFYGCPVRQCHKPQDGGAIPCTAADVTAIMADPNANVSTECSDCMSNVDPSVSCKTELAACMADK